MFGQSLHAISPVFTAVHQYFDRVPNFGDGGPPSGLAIQPFRTVSWKDNFHVSGQAGWEVSTREVNLRSRIAYQMTNERLDQA
ncbi:hypothetical protein [Bradyrhizobium sp. USDA 4454]